MQLNFILFYLDSFQFQFLAFDNTFDKEIMILLYFIEGNTPSISVS